MNNDCPSCGAVYAVAAKDVGRRIKCKKCGTALIVADDGLIIDDPDTPAAKAAAVVEDDEPYESGEDDDAVSPPTKKGKKGGQRDRRKPGPGLGLILEKVGGIPTILFCIGVFLVIWYSFMPRIGDAAVARAEAGPKKLQMEMKSRLDSVVVKPKDGATPSADDLKKAAEAAEKINKEYEPKLKEAQENVESEKISNARDVWYERYGTMFGFLFLAFGCIGYLRSEQPLILRIVAAVILGVMMIVVFVSFGGCSIPK